MRGLALYAVTTFFAVLLSAPPSFSASTSPGTNSVYESVNGLPLPSGPPFVNLLAGTIKKGLRGRVLEVNAMLTVSLPPFPISLALKAHVNGIPMEPHSAAAIGLGAIQHCDTGQPGVAPLGCTVSGIWWLDLDAAEAASPGGFIRQPLIITLTGGHIAGGPSPILLAEVSMSAVMEKK